MKSQIKNKLSIPSVTVKQALVLVVGGSKGGSAP